MKTAALVLLALASGCKAKPTDVGATGSASAESPGSGSAAGSGSSSASAFAADDKTATVCIKLDGEPAVTKCLALELATAKWSSVGQAPPSQAKPAVDKAKLDLPKLEDSAQYALETSADGKQIITTAQIKGKSAIVVLDAETGKRVKTIPLGDGTNACLEDAHFVGDAIFAIVSVCAGPGGTGYFFTRDGKQLATIDPTTNVYGAIPLHLDGDRWAFAEFGTAGFVVADVKTGKVVATYASAETPDTNDQMQGSGPAFADDTLRLTAGGKLVMVSSAGISVIDAKSLAVVKPVKFPLCLANTAAPPAP